MPARKMRVEVYDDDGNRYTITFDGHVTRDKAIRLFDLIELLGGVPEPNSNWGRRISDMSKFDKVHLIITKHFPVMWFSSRDIQSAYEQEFKEPVNLSTISTYLSRMVNREILLKSNTNNIHRYRILTEITQFSNFSR